MCVCVRVHVCVCVCVCERRRVLHRRFCINYANSSPRARGIHVCKRRAVIKRETLIIAITNVEYRGFLQDRLGSTKS